MIRRVSLLAWDEGGNVIASLDGVVRSDGLMDLVAYEAEGNRLRTLWNVNGAVASGTWPEYLGASAHDHRVVVDPSAPARVVALVHRETGVRRERDEVLALPQSLRGSRGAPAPLGGI